MPVLKCGNAASTFAAQSLIGLPLASTAVGETISQLLFPSASLAFPLPNTSPPAFGIKTRQAAARFVLTANAPPGCGTNGSVEVALIAKLIEPADARGSRLTTRPTGVGLPCTWTVSTTCTCACLPLNTVTPGEPKRSTPGIVCNCCRKTLNSVGERIQASIPSAFVATGVLRPV